MAPPRNYEEFDDDATRQEPGQDRPAAALEIASSTTAPPQSATSNLKSDVCLEESASWLSRLLFWWVVPVLGISKTRAIQFSDLGRPMQGDQPGELYGRFEPLWTTSVAAGKPALITSAMRAATHRPQDTTPSGRIVNRFSRDTAVIDSNIFGAYAAVALAVLGFAGALTSVVISTKGVMLAVAIPVTVVYVFMAQFIRKPVVELQRLEAVSSSPIFSSLSEAISGASYVHCPLQPLQLTMLTGHRTIRGQRKQEPCINRIDELIAANLTPSLTLTFAQQWLSLRLSFLGSIVSASVALTCVLGYGSDWLPVAFVAVGLSSASGVTDSLEGIVGAIASLDAELASAERVREYAHLPQQEAAADDKDTCPGDQWPSEGSVRFDNYQLRYRQGPLVLKGITASIKGGEKIGIIGRTGAGKSSMMAGLFRIEEAAGGRILIDGVDISTLGLNTLRSRLGIIPQDPVLFTGSLRYNLDPFGHTTDVDIWDALKRVQVHEFISKLPAQLLADVAERGSNFSVGQRQLICMARALLRKPKLLVLDEATANIDHETDGMVQTMLRDCFKTATVLTIAHRLETILDSDRIMVLDQGCLVEFDSPTSLLEKPDGVFRSMVDVTGPSNAARLREMAKNKRFAMPFCQ